MSLADYTTLELRAEVRRREMGEKEAGTRACTAAGEELLGKVAAGFGLAPEEVMHDTRRICARARHVLAAQLFREGYSYSQVARFLGCTPSNVFHGVSKVQNRARVAAWACPPPQFAAGYMARKGPGRPRVPKSATPG